MAIDLMEDEFWFGPMNHTAELYQFWPEECKHYYDNSLAQFYHPSNLLQLVGEFREIESAGIIRFKSTVPLKGSANLESYLKSEVKTP